MKGKLDDLWTMYFTVQIMVYLYIYDVVLPTNADIYIKELKKIVEFDILNPAGLIRLWEPDFTFSGLMSDVKQEDAMVDELSFYLIGIGFLVLLCVCLACVFCFMGRLSKKSKIKKYAVKLKTKLFFNMLIRALTITYITMAI